MFHGISKYKTCFVFIPSFFAELLMMFSRNIGVRETRDGEKLRNIKGQTRSENVMAYADMNMGADGSGIFHD
jgi:hypothetical protein